MRNFRFLSPPELTPPEEIVIEPRSPLVEEHTPLSKGEREHPLAGPHGPPCEGELRRSTRPAARKATPDNFIRQTPDNFIRTEKRKEKRKAEENIDTRDAKKPEHSIDYYVNNPFPDEEEAGIVEVREEAFVVIPETDPDSLKEARESEDWPEWERAIQVELNQLKRMGTWQLVEKPEGAVPIRNKWVLVKKRNKAGEIIKYKARMVAKGCAQRPGYDYLEMHSPVVRMETIRAILAVAATRKLFIYQLDIKGAYLNRKLKQRVYMRQPEGYDDGTGRVCMLVKTLYGLKQAGREWNQEFDSKLRRRGYVRLRSDPCVYIWCVDEDFVIITVWVDDLLLFATTIELRDKARADIEREWEVTDLGEPSKIVGIEINQTQDFISISQIRYIESILRKEGMERCNSVSTPLDPNVPLVPNPEGNEGSRSNSYARLLGQLQFVANATRPDICYAVNRLAAYTANPSLQHTTALKRILRYLSGTRTYGIVYRSLPHQSNFFYGYADAAYGNADDHRSTTGYVFIAGEGAITWSSKKQIATALSSTEAEYVALSEASCEVFWLRNVYEELGLLQEDTPTEIRGDNEGSIAMAKNPQFHKRSKHIARRWHWVRELVQDRIITVESCRDPEQTADVLTKALPRPKHQKHIKDMGLVPL